MVWGYEFKFISKWATPTEEEVAYLDAYFESDGCVGVVVDVDVFSKEVEDSIS